MSLLRKDPTRTTALQKRYMAEMRRRFAQVKRDTTEIIAKRDVLGVSKRKKNTGLEDLSVVDNVDPLPLREAWRFQTGAEKLESFRIWLQNEINAEILSVDIAGNPWTAKYVDSAYRRGVVRSYNDINKATGGETLDFTAGRRSQFLESSFAHPERLSKLEFLYTRSFQELQGITSIMSQQMQRVLAQGIANGMGPAEIARNLSRTITGITRQRALTLARTEIIAAHSEGQLDSFEELGIEGVSVLAEWSTAGDELVCPMCGEMEGAVMTIAEARGMIPRHPNCRCAWIPANVGERSASQLAKDRAGVSGQVRRSLMTELPKKSRTLSDGTLVPDLEPIPQTVSEAKKRSSWIGREATIGNNSEFICNHLETNPEWFTDYMIAIKNCIN